MKVLIACGRDGRCKHSHGVMSNLGEARRGRSERKQTGRTGRVEPKVTRKHVQGLHLPLGNALHLYPAVLAYDRHPFQVNNGYFFPLQQGQRTFSVAAAPNVIELGHTC